MSNYQSNRSRFSPCPVTFLAISSWLDKVWASSHGATLESNQKVVDFSYDIHATITPMDIFWAITVTCKIHSWVRLFFSPSSVYSTLQPYERQLARMRLTSQYQIEFSIF